MTVTATNRTDSEWKQNRAIAKKAAGKLKLAEHKMKIEDGKTYFADAWTLGNHYYVERFTTVYPDGSKWTRICVSTEYKDARENYIPDIYYQEDWYGEHDPKFEIQTSAYGSMNPEEIKKVIAGYQEAIEAVEILTKEFIK